MILEVLSSLPLLTELTFKLESSLVVLLLLSLFALVFTEFILERFLSEIGSEPVSDSLSISSNFYQPWRTMPLTSVSRSLCYWPSFYLCKYINLYSFEWVYELTATFPKIDFRKLVLLISDVWHPPLAVSLSFWYLFNETMRSFIVFSVLIASVLAHDVMTNPAGKKANDLDLLLSSLLQLEEERHLVEPKAVELDLLSQSKPPSVRGFLDILHLSYNFRF